MVTVVRVVSAGSGCDPHLPGQATATRDRRPLRRAARLLTLIEQLVEAPLTVVRAPAGTGKTSLLSAWTSTSGIATAWLSLDETDRDPVQFWLGVVAALETVVPGVASVAGPDCSAATALGRRWPSSWLTWRTSSPRPCPCPRRSTAGGRR